MTIPGTTTRSIDKDALRRKYLGARQAATTRRQRAVSARRRTARALSRRSVHAVRRTRAEDRITSRSRSSAVDFAGLVPARGWSRRAYRRAHHRERRRLRRHLVLESLSRRAMRHRVDGIHAVARRNGSSPERKVRTRAGNSRTVPTDRKAVRPLRQRAVPHRSDRSDVGSRAFALAHPHESRRFVHRAVHRHGYGTAARPEVARHSRHRIVQRTFVPHQPLGLRLHRRRPVRRADGQARRQTRRRSSAPAPPRCSACRTSRAPAGNCWCFSARRRR